MKIREKEGEETQIRTQGKLQRKRRKMKKKETSIMKQYQRIRSKLFHRFWFSFCHLNIFLSYTLVNLENFGAFLEHSIIHLNWRQNAKERKGAQGDSWINSYNKDTLQVTCCMWYFLIDFMMHGKFMWFLGYVFALA